MNRPNCSIDVDDDDESRSATKRRTEILPTPVNISRSKTALHKHGLRDDGAAAAALKLQFSKLDSSGNGMLEPDEMADLLPGLTAEDLEIIFGQIDVDGSGSVSFNEFIDFVFEAPDRQDLSGLLETDSNGFGEIKSMKDTACDIAQTPKRPVDNITFAGALLFNAVNGLMEGQGAEKIYNGFPTFEWSKSKRIKNIEPLERTDKQGQAERTTSIFSVGRAGQNLNLFYGWTEDFSKIGWFIAEERPVEGMPVKEYVLFNPSARADTPDVCSAMWESIEGDNDKRMFCEDAVITQEEEVAPDDVPEEDLEDDELWGDVSSDEDKDWQQGNFEEEWSEQPGESIRDAIDAAGDGWDSDSWLSQNAHRAQIGEDARKAREARLAARAAKEAERRAREAAEAAAAAEGDGKKVGKPGKKGKQARGKKKTNLAMCPGTMMAPGFEVKSASKFVPEDHLAQSLNDKRRRNRGGGEDDDMDDPSGTGRRRRGTDGSEDDSDDENDWRIYEDGFYIDEEFPPCQRSLGAKMQGVDGWARLSEITQEPCLFRRIVPVACFRQAFPGNVWFTSACATAAEYPAWIQSMFGKKTSLSKTGRYTVRLYHPGKKRFIHMLIDDFIPVRGKSPAFAGVTSDSEIWVALVEKAFAKMCGSYAATEWGLNTHALHYVCGGACTGIWSRLGPSRWRRSCTVWGGTDADTLDRSQGERSEESGDWRDVDEVWAMLRLAMERNYPTACHVDREKNCGLLHDRVYSVIAAQEVPTEDGWNLRMMLLRNPYDSGKWQGRWSHKSESWEKNPGVRDALGFTGRSDGSFWMSFSDFDHFFEQINFVRKSLPTQGCHRTKIQGVKRGLRKNSKEKKS